MTEVTELETGPSTETKAAVTDRRRPGRMQEISPDLIPLLRSQDQDPTIEFDDVDQNAAARGLVFGVLLSAPIWAAIAYVGSLVLSK